MEYKLNEVRPGEFEVVRSMPVVMGTFTDPEVAEKFMCFLATEDEDARREKDVANADQKPAYVGVSDPAVELKNTAVAVDISDEPWTDDELASAFRMLSADQPLKVVATRHGKCWKKLRSKWAFHKKTQGEQDAAPVVGAVVPVSDPAKTPLEKVTTAVEELAAQDACSVCGRYFKATPDNLDLCARCSHGA